MSPFSSRQIATGEHHPCSPPAEKSRRGLVRRARGRAECGPASLGSRGKKKNSGAANAERFMKAGVTLALIWWSVLSITCSITHPLLQLIYQRPNISGRKHFISAFIRL